MACRGDVSAIVWAPFVVFGLATVLLLFLPGVLQHAYRRLSARFPMVAAADPCRRFMSEPRYSWVLRLMGIATLVMWGVVAVSAICYLRSP